MKTTSLLITLIFLFSLGTGVLAQETELPNPGLLPDSPFYFLERITEAVGTFFTFGDLKKAERHTTLAAERLAEAKAVAEKGKSELAEKTLQRYENQLNNSIARAEKAQVKGENAEKVTEVMARVGQATSKHLEVLAEVYEKVPEQAKPAVENAMKVSVKGHEKAVEVLKARNALGSVPEEAPLPEKIPQEVRERIQMRAQQELEIEEALEGIDASKSLRTLCTEQGGPPETCEKLPAESFKSFKQIEDYCTELGGPAEACTTFEDKCREYGVTEANKCFLLMMTATTATVETHTPTELEASPPERDLDCPFGYVTYGQTKYCCEDSDSSSYLSQRHYYMKGTTESRIINTADGTLTSHEIKTDSCDGDRLTEWMCDTRLEITSEKFDCPKGCENGACKGLKEVMEAEQGVEQITVSSQGAYIGVLFSLINDDMQRSRELPVNYGALIISAVPDSPAASAGLRKDDIILEFNSERITQDNNLAEMLSRSKVGEVASLKVLRGEEVIIINVNLVERPAD